MSGDENGFSEPVVHLASQGSPGSYLYVLMANHLEVRIRSGDLAVNAQFPAEVDLARRYGVSLGTARHATKLLRERGLVRTVRSKGTYVVGQAGRKAPEGGKQEPGFPNGSTGGYDWPGD